MTKYFNGTYAHMAIFLKPQLPINVT